MQPVVSWAAPYESAAANELLSYTMINEVYQYNSAANKRNRERKWTAVPELSGLLFLNTRSLSPSVFRTGRRCFVNGRVLIRRIVYSYDTLGC